MTAPIPLSFLVPSFNPGKYLQEAIESIVDQLVDGDEVIVQDGGSTDGSIKDLVARSGREPWLRSVSEPDDGQSDALQKALERSTNDYVMWLNADDIVYPGALAAVRAGLESRPDLLAGRSTIFKNDGRVVRTYTPGAFTRRAFIGTGSNMFTGSFAYRTSTGSRGRRLQRGVPVLHGHGPVRPTGGDRALDRLHPRGVGGLRWHDESKGANTTWPIIREATEIRLAHSRSLRERFIAVRASTLYLIGILTQPIRHAKLYSTVRNKLRRSTRSQPHATTP